MYMYFISSHCCSCSVAESCPALCLLFQSGFLLFLFLLWLLWPKLPKLCWIEWAPLWWEWWEWVSLSCSWLEGKCFQFFTIEDICCGFIIYGFYYVEVCSFYACFLEDLNGCWIFPKTFSASIEITIWFLSFNLSMWCITLFDLQILKNPCIPKIKVT